MERGIASFVDAVFLMLISATAAAILIYSASHYGAGLQRQSSRLVMEFYARQTIRTLAAASITRPGCDKPDYLLAYIKETLSKNGKLGKDTLDDVNKAISKALAPLTGYYDYAIQLEIPGRSVNQVFGVCHACSNSGTHSPSCSTKFFNEAGDDAASSVVDTISNSLYTYSAYAPVRIRLKDGSYAVLLIRFYLWPAGTITCSTLGAT